MSFDDFSIDPRLLRTIEHMGITQPTEIQEQAIPHALCGKDLIASSKTGSGKTLAFLLPAFQRVLSHKALSKKDARVLILTPTRELASQVYTQLRLFTGNTQLKSCLIKGGENFNDQAKALAKDPHFVVATPGRLADHLEQRNLFLNGLELLILDEADRMLDLGFAKELRQINQKADHRLRQTLLFSATMDNPEVQKLSEELLSSPKRIAIGAAHSKHHDIRQQFYLCDHLDHKELLLNKLIADAKIQQLIIFTATRADTERLSQNLSQQALKCIALSGDLGQSERNRVMDQFSRGQYQILITTDLASRGLDLQNVSHVINFDMPKHSEEYVHRIGRTGRAGAKGMAYSLVGPKDWHSFKRIEAFLQEPITFSIINGLEAKFKGLKPKVNKHWQKAKVKAQDKNQQPVVKKKRFVDNKADRAGFKGVEGGFSPIKRKAKKPEQDNE